MSAAARRFAKRLLAHGLVRSGCWQALLTTWARRGVSLVLTYHRVLDKWEPTLDYSQPGMVVTVPTFERQLAFLQEHFAIVPLGALLEDPADRRPARPRCAITFDDGWRDNYERAFPILHRQGIPATIFLTTDFVGAGRAFWHTELIYLLLHGDAAPFLGDRGALTAYPGSVRASLQQCAGRGRPSSAAEVDHVVEAVKAACDEDTIQSLVGALARAAGLPRPLLPERRFFLDWDQVREMAAGGFEIGSHGCSHRIMTRLSSREAEDELVRSRAQIEARVGKAVDHFAFPNEEATDALTRLAARAGYRSACVGSAGAAASRAGILEVRRAGMHEGVSVGGTSHDDALLGLCLLRAPKSQPA